MMGPAILVGFGVLLAAASVWVWRAARRRSQPEQSQPQEQPQEPQEQHGWVSDVPVPYAVMAAEKGLDVVKYLGGWIRKEWQGYECPKCLFRNLKSVSLALEPKLCACGDYPREHFHFECYACGYVAVMRTADDVGDPLPVRRAATQSVTMKCN
jgi:predicted RNA-binding Zn-ribbon protein involved in translation (DUF1610 family)